MFFFLWQFSQAQRFTQTLESSNNYYPLIQFGFEKDGNYSIQINNSQNGFFLLGFLNISTYKNFKKSPPEINQICRNYQNSSFPFPFDFLQTETITIKGNISAKEVKVISIISCVNDKWKINFDITLENPKSKIDFRYNPLKYEQPIVLIISLVILVFWLANWFIYFNAKIPLHYLNTCTFLIIVLVRILDLCYFKDSFKNGFKKPFYIGVRFISVLQTCFILLSILFAGKGWCIVKTSIPLRQTIKGIVFVFFLILFVTLFDELQPYIGNYNFLFLLGTIVFLFLFGHELLVSIDSVSLLILVHLLLIKNRGIDPSTTPIFQKHKLYHQFEICLMAESFIIIVLLFADTFLEDQYWVSYMIFDIIDISLMAMFAFIFRIRKYDAEGYSMISEIEGCPLEEFTDGDINNLQITSDVLKGGRPWEAGESLPPPVISQKTSTVTLENPDGETTVTVRAETLQSPIL